jgi:DNA-binding transcriptional ArsR family regulator
MFVNEEASWRSGDGSTRRLTSGEAKELAELAAVLSHPLRLRMLKMLGDGPNSAIRMSEALGDGVSGGDCSYHLSVLAEAGMIELVGQQKRRGATEKMFRLTSNPMLNRLQRHHVDAAGLAEIGTVLQRASTEIERIGRQSEERLGQDRSGALEVLLGAVAVSQTAAWLPMLNF